MPELEALADFVDSVPGRYVPGLMRGQLVETEHLTRYLLAGALGRGKRVLDAGCGMAYGSKLVGEAGASSVVGIDVAPAPLEAATPLMPANVTLQVADVRSLPFTDDSFDLVVCLEVIEHVDDPGTVIRELARVLGREGVLVISSPVQGVYPSGNPHHLRELASEELGGLLAELFSHHALLRQDSRITSVITDYQLSYEPFSLAHDVRVHFGADLDADQATYCVAIASNESLPSFESVAVIGRDLQLQEWLDHYEKQRRHIEDLEHRAVVTESVAAERSELRRQLQLGEQALAEQLDAMQSSMDSLSEQLAERQARLDEMTTSFSWRATAPLRVVREFLVSRRPAL